MMLLRVQLIGALLLAALLVGWTHGAPPPPPPYTGPGDVVSGAVAWWGFRGYNQSYSGKAINLCTPSDAACEDESISNGSLVLGATGLTCNNSTTICTVKTMYDQSGALACAGGTACNVTQATIANRPIFTLSALNNIPCAVFTGSNSERLASASTLSQAQPLTLSTVAENTSGLGFIFSQASVTATLLGFNNTTLGEVSFGTVNTATANNNVFHAFNASINNAVSNNFYIDGTTNTGAVGNNNISQAPVLGAANAGNFFTGTICETGVWPSAFNGTQLANMNSNQHSYWGF